MSIELFKEIAGVPKYKQIVSSIEDAILNGKLKKGDKLPSINFVKTKYSLSRDTVFMAYNELKTRGIILSVVGKGYYIESESFNITQRIFLLFDELNAFKEVLYNSFIKTLGTNIKVDIFFHHFNNEMYNKIIKDNKGNYSIYVIMPANIKNSNEVLENLPKGKTYILDQTNDALSNYPSIYQNFKSNIYLGLLEASSLIKKYNKIVLLFSPEKQPLGILEGFNEFCNHISIESEVISTLKKRKPIKGEVYIVLEEIALLTIIKKIKKVNLDLGKEIGVISYNETLLKEIVEGGITTISTDFKLMGKRLGKMIINKEKLNIENPYRLIIRNSL